MKRNFWGKKIPTILGLFILTTGVVASIFLAGKEAIFFGRASQSEIPESIRITNISDSSFTVSYITKESVISSISISTNADLKDPIGTYVDDRDQQTGNIITRKLHYVTIRKLKPSTKYFFTITCGDNTFYENAKPFEILTAKTIDDKPSDQKPIVGKVLLPDGSDPKEAIIFLTTDNAQSLSTLAKSDGNYILPLNATLNRELNSYVSFSSDSIIKMLIIDSIYQSYVTTLIELINPVPVVTLSKNYDFKNNVQNNLSEENGTPSGNFGFPTFPSSSTLNKKDPQIISPKKNDTFVDQQPLFKGTASPGESVKITIHSPETIQEEITADSNGNWTYRPSTPLSPGEHTITIVSKDKFGVLKTLTQVFTVYASGSQVVQSATPSATTIPSVSPTSTPTPTKNISISPTSTPSATITQSPTPTPNPSTTIIPTSTTTPTLTPTPTITIKPTISIIPTQASPGSSSAIIAGIGAIALSVVGISLFLLTRGSVSSL